MPTRGSDPNFIKVALQISAIKILGISTGFYDGSQNYLMADNLHFSSILIFSGILVNNETHCSLFKTFLLIIKIIEKYKN